MRIRIEWRRRTPVKLFFSLIIIYRIHATTGGGARGISITLFFLKKKGGLNGLIGKRVVVVCVWGSSSSRRRRRGERKGRGKGKGKRATYGTNMSICSSVSLTSSGSAFIRCAQVFSTILAPESSSSSFRVRIFSNSICCQMSVWRAGSRSSEWSCPSWWPSWP